MEISDGGRDSYKHGSRVPQCNVPPLTLFLLLFLSSGRGSSLYGPAAHSPDTKTMIEHSLGAPEGRAEAGPTLAGGHEEEGDIRLGYEERCRQLCRMIKESAAQPVLSSFQVDFFYKDLWRRIPQQWQEELLAAPDKACLDLKAYCCGQPGGATCSEDADDSSIAGFLRQLDRLCVGKEQGSKEDTGEKHYCMSHKKNHEVGVMAEEVARLARENRVTCIVDIGSGKGYLAHELATRHGLRVVGVDSRPVNTAGATRYHAKLSKEQASQAKKRGGSFHPITGFMGAEQARNLVPFLRDEGSVELTGEDRLMLVTLHGCGDLTPSIARSYTECEQAVCMLVVGCCYHALSSETECACCCEGGGATVPQESWSGGRGGGSGGDGGVQPSGFPMSSIVQASEVHLCRSERSLASSSSREKLASGGGPEGDSCYHASFCRAAFQVLWHTRVKTSGQYADFPVLKRANRFRSFLEYARSGLEGQGVPADTLTDGEIEEIHDELYLRFPQVRRYAGLRMALAPLVESVIILDRVCFLRERLPGTRVDTVALFDPALSPRSVAIVASKG